MAVLFTFVGKKLLNYSLDFCKINIVLYALLSNEQQHSGGRLWTISLILN